MNNNQILNQRKKNSKSSKNTAIATTNELLLSYHLTNSSWSKIQDGSRIKTILNNNKKQIDEKRYEEENKKAFLMSQQIKNWTDTNKKYYNNKINKVYWTGQYRSDATFGNITFNPKNNPTDILIEYNNNNYLGISAKSSNRRSKLTYKNSGLKNIDKKLNTNFFSLLDKRINSLLKQYKLNNMTIKERKIYLTQKKGLSRSTKKSGRETILFLRDLLYDHLFYLDNNVLREHIKNNWIDVSPIYPQYITVIAYKRKRDYNITIKDPADNKVVNILNRNPTIMLNKLGNTSIGFADNEENKLIRLRIKWESEPLASCIKFSVEPW